MNTKQLEEIYSYFPEWKEPFYYYKDRYALMLLSYLIGGGTALKTIKRSPFAGLLHKPLVKGLTRDLKNGILTQEKLAVAWPEVPEVYYLTLGTWGSRSGHLWRYNQISRPGKSLVLQINFSMRHNRPYQEIIQPDSYHPFETYGHPIATDGLHTLGWARMDFDLDGEDALIEEIQNDWIRRALASEKYYRTWTRGSDPSVIGMAKKMHRYINEVLHPHILMWDEVILAAAVWFLREEIGVRRIFYHTFESGNRLKHISNNYGQPPRSLYTSLPRRFCFRETVEPPAFLSRNRNRKLRAILKKGRLRFYLLEL